MDSDEDSDDSGNESSEHNNHVELDKDKQELGDYSFEVLITEQILQHMNEFIEQVRSVVEVRHTFTVVKIQ